jgi:hypothetical protein
MDEMVKGTEAYLNKALNGQLRLTSRNGYVVLTKDVIYNIKNSQ